ncbi:MAG: UDP-N-acetylglucosamine 2-epimerase (non-hydrolyzing) [Gammaproteobacteria bacterium]|nr:UDP-N-acetylglucosamine 2-epimerase (non-hydrolyzing) [Gammaproteobacteria bacterium]MCP5425706.1 UDP-N-acetylglucosamine 2-epimerase (non-hydrolyzing) [Gammaproteobacteria bacterium]
MLSKKRILCVVGTRPEAIKMAPVILALKDTSWAQVRILATAQHRELLDQVLALFGIKPDIDLNIMQSNQSLAELTGRLAIALQDIMVNEKPDMVLAQGDTTTVMMTALICFYRQVPFGHVEAGLRTGNRLFPFPEEANRVITGYLSHLHFAPTETARVNLLKEGVSDDSIIVTGNTVIDSLFLTIRKPVPLDLGLDKTKRLILVTAHRRENFGSPFREICRAIRELAERNPDIQFLYPLHPNPNITDVAQEILSGHSRIVLCEPLNYAEFVSAMNQAYILLTDSGGIQEEAPALAKPVLVLRDETERPEAVEAGVVNLVGPNYERIITATERLLNDEKSYREMARGVTPYGDGHAAERIIKAMQKFFTGRPAA